MCPFVLFLDITIVEFLKAEIKGKKIILIVGLDMVPDGIPPVIFWLFNDAGTHRIKIDIGQTVDKDLAVFND